MSFDARVDVTPEVTQEETPQVLTISSLISHIKDDGMSRDDIRKKYGMTIAEAKEIFSHPKLKGIRVKKQRVMRIQLVDDTSSNNPNQTSIPMPEPTKLEELEREANTELIEALYNDPHQDNKDEITD
tara:strand:+ start:4560 stop:4943 length:384 start_codon:yes stop_codon:yes gene_type:complete